MSVIRYDLESCVGCKKCMEICPMDVFRFNSELKKSVIAYPESCQSCGQCLFYCPGRSLAITNEACGYTLNSYRSAPTGKMNHSVIFPK